MLFTDTGSLVATNPLHEDTVQMLRKGGFQYFNHIWAKADGVGLRVNIICKEDADTATFTSVLYLSGTQVVCPERKSLYESWQEITCTVNSLSNWLDSVATFVEDINLGFRPSLSPLETIKEIVKGHIEADPSTESVFYQELVGDTQNDALLVEVCRDEPYTGSLMPIKIRRDSTCPYDILLMNVCPREWSEILSGSLPLPCGKVTDFKEIPMKDLR